MNEIKYNKLLDDIRNDECNCDLYNAIAAYNAEPFAVGDSGCYDIVAEQISGTDDDWFGCPDVKTLDDDDYDFVCLCEKLGITYASCIYVYEGAGNPNKSLIIAFGCDIRDINTLDELAAYINACSDYPVAVVEETIKANNWLDTSGRDDYSICSDGEYYLVLDDNDGRAVVRSASYDEDQQKQKIVSNNLQFGRDLAEMRTRQGLSLVQLQNLCGVDNASISRIETGKYNPSVAVVNRILEPMGARLTITID